MSQYETDEEKVEAIKKWWKENGMSVVAGVGIGLAVVFGWRAWTDYRNNVSGAASADFNQLLMSTELGEQESVLKQAQLLRDNYGSTPYAALADLVAAKVQYESGDTAGAVVTLERAIANAPDPALARLAGLRLARIQVSEGDLDAAAKTVKAQDQDPAFAGEFATVRGDIAAAQGDITAARAAYEQAIASGTGLSQLIRLKLNNLPAAG